MDKIKLFKSLIGLLVLAIALWIFFRCAPLPRPTPSDVQIIGGFIEWFGVLYGLLLALLMVEVWTNYNQVAEEIDKEADALQMLHWTATYLNDQEITRRIIRDIAHYTDLILIAQRNTESQKSIKTTLHVMLTYANRFFKVGFLASQQANPVPSNPGKGAEKAEEAMRALHRTVGRAITDTEHPAVCIELLARFNEAWDTRGDRLAHAKNRVPRLFWHLLIVTSVIWLLAFFGLQFDNLAVALLVVGGAVFAVAILLLVIHDLSQPHNGELTVTFQPFESLRQNLERELAPDA